MEYDYIEVVDDSDIGDNISLTLEITLAKKKQVKIQCFKGGGPMETVWGGGGQERLTSGGSTFCFHR